MSGDWTILKVLNWTREWFTSKGIESSRLDAEVILADALGLDRVMLYAHFDRPLGDTELSEIRSRVKRRGLGEPVAYLTGHKEFWSLDFEVTPEVLIPRPDTEVLVEEVLQRAPEDANLFCDVGTGSGCIAVALATERKTAEVYALERSGPARAVAQRNIAKHDLCDRVHLIESDLLSGLDAAVILDVIVANLPYIPNADTLPVEVQDFEPSEALRSGVDGLDAIRALVGVAAGRLRPGGLLALEAGYEQLDEVAALMTSAGFLEVAIRRDYADQPRVCVGFRPTAS